MGFAEFEEKEFEKPLYNQLENGKCDVWTPGQCFEGYIGFDYGGNISTYEFWDKFGGFIPRGTILSDYNMGYIWKKMKKKRMLPDFSMNLFIQAKRPYIHSGAYRSAIYDIKHYSFEINQKQQKILEKLELKLCHRALLVYATPVFGTYGELYEHIRNKDIIDNTSFPKVSILSGHSHWFYCDSENGIAHSEPEEIKSFSIFELINAFEQVRVHSNDFKYDDNIVTLSDVIDEILEEFNEDVQVKYCISQINEMYRFYEYRQNRLENINYQIVTCFLKINIFCEVFNLDWFVL